MGYAYITSSGPQQITTDRIKRVVITVNNALTGNIQVIDGTSGSSANVATITNPPAGSRYEYWDFRVGVRVNPSAACDITVNFDGGV